MRRVTTSLLLALGLILPLGTVGALAAGAPTNDDIGNAQAVSSLFFESAPDMTGATLEDGEITCDDTGGRIDQSVWYSWSLPAPATMAIEINGDPRESVTAAVFGPFEILPASVTGLEPIHCIYDTDPDHALTEGYGPGMYLVQLTTVSAWNAGASIRIEQLPVSVAPWAAPTTIDVQAGVPINLDWGWAACSRGLAAAAIQAITQSYVLRQDDVELLGISPAEAAANWYGPDPLDVSSCLAPTTSGGRATWFYELPLLEPGTYQLDVAITIAHMLIDGVDGDGDGRIDQYPAGTVLGEGTITLNIIAGE
jgi:hypothetical protein